jgi:hypothetical protein
MKKFIARCWSAKMTDEELDPLFPESNALLKDRKI